MNNYVKEQTNISMPAVAAKSRQSCPTLWDPIDGSPPGFPVPGILQARVVEWVAFPSPMHESEKWKWSRLVVFDSLRPHGLQPTRLLRPWDSPGKSSGVGCQCLLCPSLTGMYIVHTWLWSQVHLGTNKASYCITKGKLFSLSELNRSRCKIDMMLDPHWVGVSTTWEDKLGVPSM